MRKYIFAIVFTLFISTGLAISQETPSDELAPHSETAPVKPEKKKDCKKVCVQRDGYGMCTEFEERCKEN